ncbi:biosynthetic peptidoglycan transglycosylase, partial [Allorhizocola rhizosphaerae]|uniref:biosynthetic peptidoglycan transglycosylase n=1 Tax=Allorhizocola rhizosphaerae TaxID=1872709 RepID=UPI0013C362BC
MSSYGDPHADDYEPYRYQYQAPQPDNGGYPDSDAGPGYGSGYDHGAGYDQGYYSPSPSPTPAPTSPASGRASVPVASGRASVSGAPSGRASVPSPTAGRASVRPAALPDVAGEGRGDGRGERPAKKGTSKKRRTARWQKLVIAGIGVFILLTGGGLIGGSYLYDTVPRPSALTLKNSTEVFTHNGQQIAKLGSEHRSEIAMSQLDKKIRDALIAGEDKNFYNHHGVDLWGIARAAWNNLTGGETQGASTITQQYARQA